jgi:hypothetical protein
VSTVRDQGICQPVNSLPGDPFHGVSIGR